MTEAQWKLVVDRDGVTISNDRFRLSTNESPMEQNGELVLDDDMFGMAETSEMEAALSELQSMTRRTYGQYCGLARAMEMVGERWAMLVVRDLLVGPKNFDELRGGLPRVPDNILSARLKELQRTGVVRSVEAPCSPVTYELTEYGGSLEEAISHLSRWGARSLAEPRPEDIVTVDSMIMALRTTFRPEAARGLRASYELQLGEIVLHVRVDDGALEVGRGPLPGADLVIEPGPVLKLLMAGEVTPAEVIADNSVCLIGDRELLTDFAQMFTFQPA